MPDRRERPIAIELTAVSKVYRQRNGQSITSVDNLSLAVPAGQVCGVLGPNGAGKTTTIKMICGLIIPTAGQITVDGKSVTRQRNAVMQQLGAVLEGTRNVYWRLSAWQNLMYFGRLKGCPSSVVRTRAEQLLRDLDLWERRDSPVGDFSRGMQQKVAIAAALIHDPTVVLLDEPTLGLDVHSARMVRGWVKQLAQEQGKTVILTSHELGMVQEVSERVAIIHKGRLIADKPLAELLALFREEHYRIEIGAHLTADAVHCFAGMTATERDGHTVLSGALPNQAALYEVLTQIHDQQFPLISVNLLEPSLEDVFVRMTDKA